ncbi:MAG TPA: Obg family GTPase CgtA, partial [Candidatus Acidoferrum sp.]|nr:Obg family GTPase CgtA [Candidatus Acidoferrum sp.]
GLPEDGIEQQATKLRAALPKTTPVFAISAQAHLGLQPLLRAARAEVLKAREQAAAEQIEASAGLPVIGLTDAQKFNAWNVAFDGGRFVVTGNKIEKFAARTNFDSEPGLRRLHDIMHKMGILHELDRQGAKHGDHIAIGRSGEYQLTY